jgi:hypothetical protein
MKSAPTGHSNLPQRPAEFNIAQKAGRLADDDKIQPSKIGTQSV